MRKRYLIGTLLLLLTLPKLSEAQLVIAPTQFINSGGVTTAPIYNVDGSVTSPSYSFAADTDFGWWRIEANHIGLTAGTNATKQTNCNTYTSTTNFECFSIDWQSEANRVIVGTRNGSGGGTGRTMLLGVGADGALDYYNGIFFGAVSSTAPMVFGQGSENFTVGAGNISSNAITQFNFKGGIFTASSGTQVGFSVANRFNQTGTAAGVDLLVDRTNTATGSGSQFLMWVGVGGTGIAGTRHFSIDTGGSALVSNSLSTAKLISRHDLFSGSAGSNQASSSTFTKRITSIADNSATTILTVSVPNANNACAVHVKLLSSNGSTDAFESTRTATGVVVFTRVSGGDTVGTAVALTNTGIATSSGGATHTLAYSVAAPSGASSATQTNAIQVTIDDSGNVGSNLVNVQGTIINSETSGCTVS